MFCFNIRDDSKYYMLNYISKCYIFFKRRLLYFLFFLISLGGIDLGVIKIIVIIKFFVVVWEVFYIWLLLYLFLGCGVLIL